MYHVALDLSQEQVRRLKVLAATTGTTVKGLVTGLVAEEIRNPKAEKRVKKEGTVKNND